jgi:hypothetical protein
VKKVEFNQAKEVTEQAISLLKGMEDSNFQGNLVDLFQHFTGLPKSAPPELVSWAFEKYDIPVEIASIAAYAVFDVLMVTAAFGFAHGQKVANEQAKKGMEVQ